MHILKVHNVHQALPEAIDLLYHRGVKRDSRNGAVFQLPIPVATVYEKPDERVEFHAWRDSNPFFHFYESLWMLAGRRDVAPLARYVKRMETFSDDGKKFNAAYGWRWREAVGDQLPVLIKRLRANNDDRRAVLGIWDPMMDLWQDPDPDKDKLDPAPIYCGKDAACNLTVTFQINNDRLDMVVFCRSNDIIWGCYGANAVHFSMLQEYMARAVGVPIGTYTQISVNWHAYEEVFNKTREALQEARRGNGINVVQTNPYDQFVTPFPIIEGTDFSRFDLDCRCFVQPNGKITQNTARSDYSPFFRDVAWPIVMAHDQYKDGHVAAAITILEAQCLATDWRIACIKWLERRIK